MYFQVQKAKRPGQQHRAAFVALGADGRPKITRAEADDWAKATAIAAGRMLELHRAGVINLPAQKRKVLAAVGLMRSPLMRAALREAATRGIDAAVTAIPGGAQARLIAQNALRIMRVTPGIRKLLPGFLK